MDCLQKSDWNVCKLHVIIAFFSQTVFKLYKLAKHIAWQLKIMLYSKSEIYTEFGWKFSWVDYILFCIYFVKVKLC